MIKHLALLILIASVSLLAQKSTTTIKVQIEAPEMDKQLLLTKLNENGASKGMRFESAKEDADYKITFEVAKDSRLYNGTTTDLKAAVASVFDKGGAELFRIERNARRTEGGATNALSKEIIKKLIEWRKQQG